VWEAKAKKMRHERCFDRAGRPVTQLVSAVGLYRLKTFTGGDPLTLNKRYHNMEERKAKYVQS